MFRGDFWLLDLWEFQMYVKYTLISKYAKKEKKKDKANLTVKNAKGFLITNLFDHFQVFQLMVNILNKDHLCGCWIKLFFAYYQWLSWR